MFNTKLPTHSELPTTRQLLRSTVIAFFVAVALLVTVVVPAEYAIDPTGVGRVLGMTQMGELKAALAQEAAAAANTEQSPAAPGQAAAAGRQASHEQVATTSVVEPVSVPSPALKSDDMTVTLKPGEATEIKLEMLNGKTVSYEWSASGGLVNHDTHGEPYNGPEGYYHSYSKAKQVNGDKGELTAKFDGTHGWFWRNRGESDVTIKLKTKGEYLKVKRAS